ncbi:uncharacterized protein LOC119388677 [Rhipicephalus sanguineus]|uniref:uncharacterized protein LOC119388677 n=1 Tax=Rhipicephalus sanguineus TaxID=34632 RepID=UPI0018941930|nr:uncharacterized protein LOC119388677 [Rhipicephalus sanguineus]
MGARAEAKVPKESTASIRTSEELKLSPTVCKIGRSLNDIGGSPQVERRRRNSWGTSGIPKLSSNPLVATLAPKLRRAAFNRVKPAAGTSFCAQNTSVAALIMATHQRGNRHMTV